MVAADLPGLAVRAVRPGDAAALAELVTEVERIAAGAGCFAVEITSSLYRHDAHRFYLRLGYEKRPARFLKPLPHDGDSTR